MLKTISDIVNYPKYKVNRYKLLKNEVYQIFTYKKSTAKGMKGSSGLFVKTCVIFQNFCHVF